MCPSRVAGRTVRMGNLKAGQNPLDKLQNKCAVRFDAKQLKIVQQLLMATFIYVLFCVCVCLRDCVRMFELWLMCICACWRSLWAAFCDCISAMSNYMLALLFSQKLLLLLKHLRHVCVCMSVCVRMRVCVSRNNFVMLLFHVYCLDF